MIAVGRWAWQQALVLSARAAPADTVVWTAGTPARGAPVRGTLLVADMPAQLQVDTQAPAQGTLRQEQGTPREPGPGTPALEDTLEPELEP